jgi:hypothetical protein
MHPEEDGRYSLFHPAFIVYGALDSARGLFRTNQVYQKPNARCQPLPEAEARDERTLEAVGCTPWFGVAPLLSRAWPWIV